MRQRSGPLRRQVELPWTPLVIAAGVGVLVVVLAWLLGPGVFGIGAAQQGTVVTAEVTGPMPCISPNAQETVRFRHGVKNRNGTLSACGHDRGERVDVQVPADAPDTGLISVQAVAAVSGGGGLHRPVGLVLVVLSCFAGGLYAFLVAGGPRRPAPI